MKALVYDWETTGLLKHRTTKLALQPHVIEFGGVLIDHKGKILQELEILINPLMKLEPIITRITGLTDEDLRDKDDFETHLKPIKKLFKKADIQIAHNLPFDSGVLAIELERLGITNFPWPKLSLCTVQENQPKYGYRIKLIDLYEKVMGERWEQTHRALDDAKRLAEIVIKEGYLENFMAAAKS